MRFISFFRTCFRVMKAVPAALHINNYRKKLLGTVSGSNEFTINVLDSDIAADISIFRSLTDIKIIMVFSGLH